MNFGIKTSFIYLYHAYINIINRTKLSYNLFIIHLHEQPFIRISHRVNIFNLNMNPVILGFDFGQALKEFLCVRLEDLCRSSKWCWIIFNEQQRCHEFSQGNNLALCQTQFLQVIVNKKGQNVILNFNKLKKM